MHLLIMAAALACALPAADLTFDRFPRPIRTVVYDLPGLPPAMADAIKQSIRDNFHDAEVIDAATQPKPAGPFLLLTMLSDDAKLLTRLAAPLPVKWSDGNLVWGDFSAPLKQSAVTFAVRNPFGEGVAVVTAYGSFEMMRGYNLQPDMSYLIFQGTNVVRRGAYDDNYAEVRRDRVKLADALTDVHELFATIRRIHPASREEQLRRLETEAAASVELAAHDGSLTIEALAWVLADTMGSLHDGHSWMNWRPQMSDRDMSGRRFPPFRLSALDGRFSISAAKDTTLIGRELVAVNSKPTEEFLAPILRRNSAETAIYRAYRFAAEQDFWWWFSDLAGTTPNCCTLTLRDDAGKTTQRVIQPVSVAEYPTAPAKPRPATHVELLADGKVAHFVYPAFQYTDVERRKVDESFQQIFAAGVKDLIIDLRGNGGGNSFMGDYILSYLSAQPVEQGPVRVRVSRELYQEWKKTANLPPLADVMVEQFIGKVVASEDPEMKAFDAMQPKPPARVQHFTGRVWLLVDNGTFSAADMFTAAFRDYGLGKIVGYQTGQPPIIFGNLLPFALKNSHIPYTVSSIEFHPPKPRPGDDEHGIAPDVPVNAKLLEPYRDQPDPVLAFTVARATMR